MRLQGGLLLFALLLPAVSGCYGEPVAQAPPTDNAWAQGIIAHADSYCLEEGYERGTAHFDDCVKNKAMTDALQQKVLQEAASGQYAGPTPPAQVYVVQPASSSCVPDVTGMSAGAAFAAGLRGC
jgi:putative hemolysin